MVLRLGSEDVPDIGAMSDLYEQRIRALGFGPLAMYYANPEQHQRKLRSYGSVLSGLTGDPSILDIGCGYGALLDHWTPTGRYLGIDVGSTFVEEARLQHPNYDFELVVPGGIVGNFDVAVLAGVLSSTPSPLSLLRSAFDASTCQTLFDITLDDRLPSSFRDLNRLAVDEVSALAHEAGMTCEVLLDVSETWLICRATRA